MTKVVAPGIIVIEQTAPAICTDCKASKELRPYGKDGAWVCFECMMKDEAEGFKHFKKLTSGERDI